MLWTEVTIETTPAKEDHRKRVARARRARMEAHLLRSVLEVGLFKLDNAMVGGIANDIAMGVKAGDYDVVSVGVATDLLLGAKAEAIGRIIGGEADVSYIHAMTAHVPRSFGIPAVRAARIVEEAFLFLRRDGPVEIAWWPEHDPFD